MRNLKLIIILLLLSCNPKFISGLKAQKFLEFEHITIADGLSQSVIYCIMQDSRGYMWFGTQDGLNKFNGYSFEIYKYDHEDTNTISSNHVYCFSEDPDGNLWIGTLTGLNKYDWKTGKFTRYYHVPNNPNSLNSNIVYGVYADKQGIIWILNANGINKYNPKSKQFKFYSYHTDFLTVYSGNRPLPIIEDKEGLIWIGTTKGLYCFNKNNKQFIKYKFEPHNPNSLSNDVVNEIYEDKQGNLWIGTLNGLNVFDKKTKKFERFYRDESNPNSLIHNSVNVITQDHDGNFWIGTERGMSKFNPATHVFTNYRNKLDEPTSLSYDVILSICEDNSHNLWVGTEGGCLNKTDLKEKKFQLYRKSNSANSVNLSDNMIASIFVDDERLIWIGTWGSGLNIYNRETGEIQYFSEKLQGKQKICNDYVQVIFKDKRGKIWLGTRNGINIWDEENKKFIPFSDYIYFAKNLPLKRIYSIIEDKSSNIWIATEAGLFRINLFTRELSEYYHRTIDPSSLSSDKIYSLLEDREGYIWIGAVNGVNKYDPNNNMFYRMNKIILSQPTQMINVIYDILEDKDGILWFGTGNGLIKYDKKTNVLRYYTIKHGLPNELIYSILEDNKSNLWVSTNRGLAMLDKTTDKFKCYDITDGLQDYEYNLGAKYKSKAGELFFGGINGFNSFYPDSIKDNTFIPNIVITSFEKINNAGVKSSLYIEDKEQVTLSYKDFTFTVEFAALDYTLPEKNNYAYKMEGLQDDWVYIGNHRFASFSKLPPGEYIFHVKGSNNNLIWNEKGTSLKIKILPPFWKTWWFTSLEILFVIFIVLLYIKMRERKLVRDKKILETKVQERTQQIQQQKEEIQAQKEHLEIVNEQLEKLSIVARQTDNAVMIMDAEGNFEWVNEGFKRFYGGVTLEQLIEERGKNIISASANPQIKEVLKNCIKEKKSAIYEGLVEWKSGYKIWAQTTITPILDRQGNVIKLVAIDSDITKLKDAQEEILQQKEEILAQRELLVETNKVLEKHIILVRDSIDYAKRIQESILPSDAYINRYLSDAFIFYIPKDIVSGDFYWLYPEEDKLFFAVADCTGHGVPGAFMSIIGYNLLDLIVKECPDDTPASILEKLKILLPKSLHQRQEQFSIKDGINIAMCSLSTTTNTLQFAGSYNPLYLIRNNELIEYKADRIPIDNVPCKRDFKFKNHIINLQKDDFIYIFTDGFVDQKGGVNNKKFYYGHFRDLLIKIHQLPPEEQKQHLEKVFYEWKGENMQIDDILIMGKRF